MTIVGHCDQRFRMVREEFERSFAERGEIGASVCVTHEGETVVDLWGGFADRVARTLWERDTITLVWSCTKGATALCAHVLATRGQLDLDAPVARYWPEFAQAGKADIPVRWLLDHQAGLPAFRRPVRSGGVYDWDYMTDLLATESPFWAPGTRQGYHATTFGFLVGEVVRRVSGRPLDRYFREEIADPLGLDFHIGLPDDAGPRVALGIKPDPTPPGEAPSLFLVRTGEQDSLQALAWKNTGRETSPRDYESPAARRAVLPSSGAITNARGLAGMYAALSLGGTWKGIQLVNGKALSRMTAVSAASAKDAVLLIGLRFSLGYWKSSDNRTAPPGVRDSLILSESAFGHPGMGGSLGFADPDARMSFGYAMNKMGRGVVLNDRGQSLIDATYRSLGYRTNQPGRWVR